MTARWRGAALICGLLTACGGALNVELPPAAAVASGTPSPETAGPIESAVPSPAPSSPEQMGSSAPVGGVLAALRTLEVKGRAPRTGYDRDLFGPAWADTDRNGSDTRDDILARDLTAVGYEPGTRDCVVITGVLDEPYTGSTLTFVKAEADALHIDHVVALSDAWQKGAQLWEPGKRLAFANDRLNLLAVDGPTNASKSDGDAATSLPPNRGYRCPTRRATCGWVGARV